MPQYEFGEWLPDQPVIALPGLQDCYNAIPTARGYRPFPGLVKEIGKDPLPSKCRGAFTGETENGTEFIVAGTDSNNNDAKLNVAFGSQMGWIDASPSTALSTMDAAAKWDFAQYGDQVIAVAKGIDPQVINLSTTPSSGSFSDLGAGASQAGCVAVFKNFAILGDLVGVDGSSSGNAAAIGTRSNAIHWSAIGDLTNWPVVGSDAAVNAQSDWQLLDGNGGAVTAIVPGGEYCAIFQERATWRLDYVGSPNVFSLRLIEASTGCAIPRSAVAVNNVVYFLSNQGLMAFDGSSVRSIGSERVDKTFLDRLDRTYVDRVFAAHNSELHCVFWSLQESEESAQFMFSYQYEMDRWSEVYVGNAECLFSALEPNVTGSLDTEPYASLKMDNAAGTSGDPSTLQNANLDSLGVSRGRSVLGVFSNRSLSTFSDFQNVSTVKIETGDLEVPDGRRAIVKYIRPAVDASNLYLVVHGRNSQSENYISKNYRDSKNDGVYLPKTPLFNYNGVHHTPGRVGGRYLKASFSASGLVELYGFDVELQKATSKR